MVCATIYCFGTDVSVLVELSGQSAAVVRAVLTRLRKTRVLTGQTLKAGDGWKGKHGAFGLMLDAMVAAGELYRPADPKRSAAIRRRVMPTRRAPYKTRTVVAPGAVYTPKVAKSNPMYGLAEWDKKK